MINLRGISVFMPMLPVVPPGTWRRGSAPLSLSRWVRQLVVIPNSRHEPYYHCILEIFDLLSPFSNGKQVGLAKMISGEPDPSK